MPADGYVLALFDIAYAATRYHVSGCTPPSHLDRPSASELPRSEGCEQGRNACSVSNKIEGKTPVRKADAHETAPLKPGEPDYHVGYEWKETNRVLHEWVPLINSGRPCREDLYGRLLPRLLAPVAAAAVGLSTQQLGEQPAYPASRCKLWVMSCVGVLANCRYAG